VTLILFPLPFKAYLFVHLFRKVERQSDLPGPRRPQVRFYSFAFRLDFSVFSQNVRFSVWSSSMAKDPKCRIGLARSFGSAKISPVQIKMIQHIPYANIEFRQKWVLPIFFLDLLLFIFILPFFDSKVGNESDVWTVRSSTSQSLSRFLASNQS